MRFHELLLLAALALLSACNPCAEVDALPGGPDDPEGRAPKYQAIGDSILATLAGTCDAIPITRPSATRSPTTSATKIRAKDWALSGLRPSPLLGAPHTSANNQPARS